nr:hypothetical protein [Tanacetum cinerariifolium]
RVTKRVAHRRLIGVERPHGYPLKGVHRQDGVVAGAVGVRHGIIDRQRGRQVVALAVARFGVDGNAAAARRDGVAARHAHHYAVAHLIEQLNLAEQPGA